jgi:hypothetical protein
MARRSLALSFALALAALVAAGRARAETVEELDARLEQELAAVSPAAVAPFRDANAARLAGDFAHARDLFGRVMGLAPGFIPATRRACQADFELGNRSEALALCRRAVEREGSPLDDVTLAIVLVTPPASASEIAEARSLARRAMENAPGDAYVVASACEVAEDAHDVELVRAAADSFDASTTDSRELVCKAIASATRGDFDRAEELARRAERAGAPEAATHLSEAIRAARPVDARVLSTVLRVVAALAAALISSALLALGVGALVQREAGRERAVSPGLGVLSRFTLWLFAAAAVLAIPASVAAAIVVVGVSMQRWLTPGGVSTALIAASAAAVLSTIGARKLLLRAEERPGLRLTREAQPRLYAFVDEVAAKVGAPPVDAVYLTPDVEVSALARARLWERPVSASERAVVIGAGALAGLGATDLGALVAAEVAELAPGGAGGEFARTTRRAFGDAASLRQSWWFLRVLAATFARASRGAIAADRRAARGRVNDAYGPESERAARRLAELRDQHAALVAALEETEGEPPANIYAKPSPSSPEVDPSAWSLFDARAELEEAMTARLFAGR